MRILETDGKWNLLVKTPKEKEFIKFEMSEIKGDKFGFPKIDKILEKRNQYKCFSFGRQFRNTV
jgi:hypothetical protein